MNLLKIWQELSTQGKIYTLCQAGYFLLMVTGLVILIQIKNKL